MSTRVLYYVVLSYEKATATAEAATSPAKTRRRVVSHIKRTLEAKKENKELHHELSHTATRPPN